MGILDKVKGAFGIDEEEYEDDELIGNPTDLASYYFALENDFEKLKADRNFEKELEIPFDSNRNGIETSRTRIPDSFGSRKRC